MDDLTQYGYMARHDKTEPAAWRGADVGQATAIARRAAYEDNQRRQLAREIKTVKRLALAAVLILAVLLAGVGAGAGLIATIGQAPAHACAVVQLRC